MSQWWSSMCVLQCVDINVHVWICENKNIIGTPKVDDVNFSQKNDQPFGRTWTHWYNVGIAIINHPLITINGWYKTIKNWGGLLLLYPHYSQHEYGGHAVNLVNPAPDWPPLTGKALSKRFNFLTRSTRSMWNLWLFFTASQDLLSVVIKHGVLEAMDQWTLDSWFS